MQLKNAALILETYFWSNIAWPCFKQMKIDKILNYN